MIQQMTTIYVDDMKPEFVTALTPKPNGEQGVTICLRPAIVDMDQRLVMGMTFFGTLSELEEFGAKFLSAVIEAREVLDDSSQVAAL
jgi:hypothetical protein